MLNTSLYIYGDDINYWEHNVSDCNEVNNKSLGYFWNMTGGTIDGSQYGQIILANCTDVIVENGILDNTTAGVELGYSSFCNVTNSSMSDGIYGAILYASTNNTI